MYLRRHNFVNYLYDNYICSNTGTTTYYLGERFHHSQRSLACVQEFGGTEMIPDSEFHLTQVPVVLITKEPILVWAIKKLSEQKILPNKAAEIPVHLQNHHRSQ